ncbi:hypothetical protein [Actibacterium sp. 188UL27-1]|uniref:hypothetical protein n=1 Tax=Actibacterium sp. 188UL27-1 TaxID=2786961 RepID=UPI0019581169|nr:hypothetical protein [Actibacterium sp. 188UL27-1]MBM7068431.1 hypothetical protein [Actibacterium sp. 188UL27-1]
MAHMIHHQVARFVLRVSAMLIAGVWRSRSLSEIEAALRQSPQPRRAVLVLFPLVLLFLLSLIAAQFGWIAMLVFWMGVIALVN